MRIDVSHISKRFGEFVALIITLLMIAFFAYNQAANTGFFTPAFGSQAMFFFFGPMVLSMAAPFMRAAIGRRNPARPLEVASNVFGAIAAIWLLTAFPFDFTHLADALPGSGRLCQQQRGVPVERREHRAFGRVQLLIEAPRPARHVPGLARHVRGPAG